MAESEKHVPHGLVGERANDALLMPMRALDVLARHADEGGAGDPFPQGHGNRQLGHAGNLAYTTVMGSTLNPDCQSSVLKLLGWQ